MSSHSHRHRLAMPTEKPKIDCERSPRIVSSFVDFLNSVEPAPGVDTKSLDVTKDCLINVDASFIGSTRNPSLLGMFEPPERSDELKMISDLKNVRIKVNKVAPTSSSMENDDDDYDSNSEPLNLMGDGEWTSKLSTLGISKDELIGKYFAALEKMKYFSTTIDGNDDLIKVPKVTRLIQDAFTRRLPGHGSIIVAARYGVGEDEGILIASDRKYTYSDGTIEFKDKIHQTGNQFFAGTGNTNVVKNVLDQYQDDGGSTMSVEDGALLLKKIFEDFASQVEFSKDDKYAPHLCEFVICGRTNNKPDMHIVFCEWEEKQEFVSEITYCVALGSGSEYTNRFMDKSVPRSTFEELWIHTNEEIQQAYEGDAEYCGGFIDRGRINTDCSLLIEREVNRPNPVE